MRGINLEPRYSSSCRCFRLIAELGNWEACILTKESIGPRVHLVLPVCRHEFFLNNMSSSAPSSGVFLNPQVLDDYLTPSQACVNPLFTEKKKEDAPRTSSSAANSSNVTTASSSSSSQAAGGVVPRKKRRQRRPLVASSDESLNGHSARISLEDPNSSSSTKQQAAAPLSIADCLACSGCITTAETVLLQQHEEAVKQLMTETDNAPRKRRVVTISPASWADLLRHFDVYVSSDANADDAQQLLTLQRQLATMLQETLNVSLVLDGAVPLLWSRYEAAREFCDNYKSRRGMDDQMELGGEEADQITMQVDNDNSMQTSSSKNPQQLLLLSSSCPALVCWVETSLPTAVPHLSTAKSAMGLGGSYLRRIRPDNSDLQHIAIMPCHDKKLEASRSEDVDIVLTTRECFDLLRQALSRNGNVQSMRRHLLSRPLASVLYDKDLMNQSVPVSNGNQSLATFISSSLPSTAPASLVQDTAMALDDNNDSTSFFPWSSGGYAETVFVQAARELFSIDIEQVIWRPVMHNRNAGVSSSSVPKQSARVAAASKQASARRRDLYEAVFRLVSSRRRTIYLHTSFGDYFGSGTGPALCRGIWDADVATGLAIL